MSGCGLKGRPSIESRMKTLKSNWSVIHDLLVGQNSSGFGWDTEKKCVIAENDVWDAYVKAHPKAAKLRNTSFPYYDELCDVWAKDRATWKDAETPTDVIEELERNEVNIEDSNGLDDILFSMSFSRSSNEGETQGKRKRKRREFDDCLVEALEKTSKLLMEQSSAMLSKAIAGFDTTEKQMKVHGELAKIDTLSTLARHKAGFMIASDSSKLNLFFALPDDEKKEWVTALLNGEF